MNLKQEHYMLTILQEGRHYQGCQKTLYFTAVFEPDGEAGRNQSGNPYFSAKYGSRQTDTSR